MKKTILLAFAFCVAVLTVKGQDSSSISDDDLRKYAVMMDSINTMKKDLLEEISTMVKSNDGMTNARYNELSKIVNDETKLADAKATQEEIDFIKQVQEKKNEGTAEITETFQSLARDYVGAESYNNIKNSLTSDSSLKERYDAILADVEGANNTSTEQAKK